MNAKQMMAAVGLLAMSLTAMAADVETVTITGKSGVSRAEVNAQLRKAIANNEIERGNLAVLHKLLAPAQDPQLAHAAGTAVAAR